MNGDGVTRDVELVEDAITKTFFKRFDFHLFTYESFLGFGFESFVIGAIAAVAFGVVIGVTSSINPLLVAILLFVAFAVPLTGSTHYDPRLGTLTSVTFITSLRATQVYLGVAPATVAFLQLAGIWGLIQVFLIGYLPGKIIPTSEHLGFLTKGLAGIAVLYGASEYFVWTKAMELGLSSNVILAYPVWSIFLIAGASSVATFIFANTFCPYMMVPLLSRNNNARYCGSGNYIFDMESQVKIDQKTIEAASKRGFKLVSELPAVTVFSCPRGGMISVYATGKVLIRKVNKGTANRVFNNLSTILKASSSNN